MVMLRSSGAVEAAEPKRAPPEMDSSSEFLSLRRPLRKAAPSKRGLDDSYSSPENTPTNVSPSHLQQDCFSAWGNFYFSCVYILRVANSSKLTFNNMGF